MRAHDRPPRTARERLVGRDLPADARRILRGVLEALEPGALLLRHLSLERDVLKLGPRRLPLGAGTRVVLVGAGKASAAMAAAALKVLDGRVHRGVVLAVDGTGRDLGPVRCLPCAHPAPDARSEAGTRELLDAVSGLTPRDVVLALWSGGGSACLGLPVPGIALEEVAEATRVLLSGRFQIQQVNQVRRVCLEAGDGGVARHASPARVLSAVLCDAPLSDVASGPTLPGGFGLESTLGSLRNWGAWERLPASVRARLESLEGKTRRPDPLDRERVFHVSVGGPETAVEAACALAHAMGYEADPLEQPLQWEARLQGQMLARQLKASAGKGPRALVAAGETSVAVKGKGRGGRNQELALSAALELSGAEGLALLSCATDGVDGSSDAAGAVVTGATCADPKSAAEARSALEDNDSHGFFRDRPERIATGPTGTNVADLVLGLSGV